MRKQLNEINHVSSLLTDEIYQLAYLADGHCSGYDEAQKETCKELNALCDSFVNDLERKLEKFNTNIKNLIH